MTRPHEKTEVEKAIAFEAIRSRIPDAWTLLDIVESTNAPENLPDDGSDLTLEARDGWKVTFFYDVGELDYIDEMRSPDGLVIDPWEWPMGAVGGSTLMAWRSMGDRTRLMALRESNPIRTIDCIPLDHQGCIPVSEEERDGIDYGAIELIGGYLDWDGSRILRIPAPAEDERPDPLAGLFLHVTPRCEHVWDGQPIVLDGGLGWSTTCSKCGADAMSVTLREGI